jgi:hypothetical protein
MNARIGRRPGTCLAAGAGGLVPCGGKPGSCSDRWPGLPGCLNGIWKESGSYPKSTAYTGIGREQAST